jgi:pyrroline-5-carboxylate reductase
LNDNIGFVGYGNMGQALGAACIQSGRASTIYVVESNQDHANYLTTTYSYIKVVSLADLIQTCDTIFLAFKPQQLADFSKGLPQGFTKEHVIVSMLAGVSIQTCIDGLGHANIVRIMPNTPAVLQKGVTAVFFADAVLESQRQWCLNVFESFGQVILLNSEQEIDVMTALSGSGPAFFYRMVQAMAQFGEDQGLTQNQALQAATHTMLGAGEMLTQQPHPQQLIDQVTSPNGTTHAGLMCMNDLDFNGTIGKVLDSAYQRAISLSKES